MVRLSIVFYVPGMPFRGDSLTKHSLGGSETAGLSVAKELAKLGHDVRVFANTNAPHVDKEGVQYVPIQLFSRYAPMIPHDVCIVQRAPGIFGSHMESKLNVLWVHDLAMLRQASEVKSAMWNIDRVFAVSRYHSKQYSDAFELPGEIMYATRNGIHLDLAPEASERNPKQVVYTARPERGLDVLLNKIMPRIWEADPDVRLKIAAYDNTVEHMRQFYATINAMIAKNADRVQMLGALTKPELYKLYSESALYLYPTPSPINPLFSEVSCITAMECMMCGLPMVTSNRGALPETLDKDASVLIDGDPMSDEYQNRFVDSTIRLLNSDLRSTMGTIGRRRAKTLDWSGVAKDWSARFEEWIAERAANKKAVARHLVRRSDIIVARDIAREMNDQALLADIQEHYGWADDREAYREHYEKIGATHTDVYEQMGLEPRFKAICQKLEARKFTSGKLLDFGCAHGSYSVHLSNRFPEMKVYGVDVDRFGIEWAEKHRANHAEHPENLNFRLIESPGDLAGEQYDVILLGEVLEHVPEPWKLLTEVEGLARQDGLMVITTPYGPWEQDSYRTYPHRCHLWEIDFFALREMLGGKQKLEIEQTFLRQSSIDASALGVCVSTYLEDGHPVGMINKTRKRTLVNPRQTVSVMMICGPNAEQTLAWCLDSVQDVADEIVIGDTGMSDEGKAIANRYGARLVPAPSPLIAGFDEARNAPLASCTMDWVLWIDSDERLLNPFNLHKYLRKNIFVGYGIKQHHFSVDARFDPDMPVRLFRNGAGLRFFGSCHEHPETNLNDGPGMSIVLSDVHIAHIGYLTENTRRIRFGRNSPLMDMSREKFPDRLLNKFFTMRDKMLLVNYELQQNGGQVTENCKREAQTVIDLHRKYFRGKSTYMGHEAIKYYSDACRVLGIGAEVAIAVNSAKAGEPDKKLDRLHFGSVEDLQAELAARAEASLGVYCNPMW